MKPVHYEFSLRRAHCGVKLSFKTFATKNPHHVNCPKCAGAAKRDAADYDKRNHPS